MVDLTTGTRLTYRELNERCNRVAHALSETEHRTGDRVATLLLNGSEFVELMAIVVRSDKSLTTEELTDWCDGRLARFKLPQAVEFVDVIPRNPSGKILKRLLRDRFPGPSPE